MLTIMIRRVVLVLLLLILPPLYSAWLVDDTKGDDEDHDHHHGERCGAPHVSELDAELDQARMRRLLASDSYLGRRLQKLSCDQLCVGCVEIDVAFHYMAFNYQGTTVLPHPRAIMQRIDAGDTSVRVSDFTTRAGFLSILRNQITFANNALRGTPFVLRLREDAISLTDNENYMRFPLDFQEEIALNTGLGDPEVLDVYLCHTIITRSEASNPPLRVGLSYFPSQQLTVNPDGMFLRYDILTGGGFFSLDQGITFLHEWGHWMGLCTSAHKSHAAVRSQIS